MNERYICPDCHSIYSKEDLEDNEDGTCRVCGFPLQKLENDKPKVTVYFNNADINLQESIKLIKECGQKKVWESIEYIKNAEDRYTERTKFFLALSWLNKKVEIFD